jgi:GPH family glycoside/pentoside/hexuronide:cation symporter/probable glucitol transport protein GutA
MSSISAQTTTAIDPERPKFTNLQRLAFGMGNYGCCFSWMLTSSYLMMFMTDVAKLNVAFVGTIMLISRAWDAVNDPIIGALADGTKSKWGRYRPWVIFPAIPMLALNVLLFTTFPSWGQTARTWWALGIYFLQVLIYTMINIPYSAMPAVLTLDSVERARLSGWRMSGATISGLIIAFFALRIVNWAGKGDDAKGFFVAALCFSLLALPCFLWCFFGTKEVVNAPVRKVPFFKMLRTVKGNKPMWLILGAFFILGLNGAGGSMAIYWWTYKVGNRLMFANASIIASVAGIFGTMALPMIAHKFKNKRDIAILAMALNGGSLFIRNFIPAWNGNAWMALYLFFSAISSFGVYLNLSILYGMAPDVTEYSTYHYGIHAAGFLSSFINFGNKMGSALTTAAAGWLLAWVGYAANQTQTPRTLNLIQGMFHLYSAGIMIIGIVLMLFYDLDKEKLDDLADKVSRGEYAPGVVPVGE